MIRFAALLAFLVSFAAHGQTDKFSEAEKKDLESALGETGGGSLEIARALERHLQKYPKSPQAAEMERTILNEAIDSNDTRRILLYGERVLAREPDVPKYLERVARALLTSDSKENAERALKYAKRFEEILTSLEKQGLSSPRNRAVMLDELDRAHARALVFQARASGNLSKFEEAIALAKRSFERAPTAEGAREIGKWLAKSGQELEAVHRYAEAFTVRDPKNTEADRARDRSRMAELYRKVKGSEEGLGDLILEAYDRMTGVARQRELIAAKRDPNSAASHPMQFTLPAIEGPPLQLSSLKGKAIVLDFWATWCGPCRVQHPLYQAVRERFKQNDKVVFVAIATDDDRNVVKPFLEQHKWTKEHSYYDDGLGAFLKVSSIPTTIVIDASGEVSTRMNGFIPDRFVDQLTQRIKDALAVPVAEPK